jgi:hypothetical protein
MSSRGRQGDFIVESRILSVLESGIEPIPAKVASVLKQRFRTLFDRKPDVRPIGCHVGLPAFQSWRGRGGGICDEVARTVT